VNDFTPARILYSGSCPICLNEDTEGGFCALECGHVFHCECIQRYANSASQSGIFRDKVCPVCRGPLNRMVRVDPPFEFGRKRRLRKRQVR
jgi:predicted DCC family thiol-disulfide oxidoreductase YuxK